MSKQAEYSKKLPVLHQVAVVDIIDAMPPLVRFAFEKAMKEADVEYKLADDDGYFTDGRYQGKKQNSYAKAFYLGSVSLTHWQVFKLFLPLIETPLGEVKHWPTLDECIAHWQTIPEGLQRYMQSPVATLEA